MTLVVSPEALRGDRVEVAGDDYRHLFRALRMQRGDRLRVVDGRGDARYGRVESIDRRTGSVALGEAAPDAEPDRSVELAIATIRPERAAWAVEKATEVGVVAIYWYRCERAPRRYGEGQLQRFRRVAVSAVGQCGRSVVPAIESLDWDGLLSRVADRPTRVLDPSGRVLAAGAEPSTLLIVGPEGGLAEAELEALCERGARSWRLGVSILRTETAAVVASGIALHGGHA